MSFRGAILLIPSIRALRLVNFQGRNGRTLRSANIRTNSLYTSHVKLVSGKENAHQLGNLSKAVMTFCQLKISYNVLFILL